MQRMDRRMYMLGFYKDLTYFTTYVVVINISVDTMVSVNYFSSS